MANGQARRCLAIVGSEPSHPCSGCGRSFPEVEFFVRRRGKDAKRYWQSACKECSRRRSRAATNSKTEAGLTRSRQYYLKKRYGMTLDDWQTLWAAQSERCGLCGAAETDGKYWHVDHDHTSGVVRGILCHGCNTGLGNFRDDPSRLELAINYLRRAVTNGAG